MPAPVSLPFRIFAVDPATTDSGWAVLDVTSLHPLQINIVKTGHIDGQKLIRTQKEMLAKFSKQFCVLQALQKIYEDLIEEYKPDQIASEGAFAHLHPAAAFALILVINVLRRVSHAFLGKDIVEIPPSVSKRAWTGSGGADKDHMRFAYQSNKWISGQVADAVITEHEIDAVAHGNGYARVHLLGDITQVSAKEKRRLKREKQKAKQSG